MEKKPVHALRELQAGLTFLAKRTSRSWVDLIREASELYVAGNSVSYPDS